MLEPPGVLGLEYGKRTPLVALVVHVMYGALVVALYHVPPA